MKNDFISIAPIENRNSFKLHWPERFLRWRSPALSLVTLQMASNNFHLIGTLVFLAVVNGINRQWSTIIQWVILTQYRSHFKMDRICLIVFRQTTTAYEETVANTVTLRERDEEEKKCICNDFLKWQRVICLAQDYAITNRSCTTFHHISFSFYFYFSIKFHNFSRFFLCTAHYHRSLLFRRQFQFLYFIEFIHATASRDEKKRVCNGNDIANKKFVTNFVVNFRLIRFASFFLLSLSFVIGFIASRKFSHKKNHNFFFKKLNC